MSPFRSRFARFPTIACSSLLLSAFFPWSRSSYADPGSTQTGGEVVQPKQSPLAVDSNSRQPARDISPQNSVSLSALLAFAESHSPNLLVARSSSLQANAARTAADVLLPTNPQLSVALGPRFGISGTGLDVDVSLSQQLQIGGERGARRDAAVKFGQLTTAQIELVKWAVHCEVHAGFHRALVERERVHLAERVVAFQTEVWRVVERQAAAGEVAPFTLRLAQAEVAQATQTLVAAQQAWLAARIRLAQLSGWSAATPPVPSGSLDTPQEPPALALLVASARQHLPRLRAASARVQEATARVTVAEREAWPRPSIGLQYRREGNPTSEGPYDMVMGAVSIPIPSFQLNQGARAQAHADVGVANAELGAAHQLLEAHIAEARSEVVAAAARTHAYGTEILPRFEENLTMLRRAFELGELDILALSTGRERFFRIQSDALSAQQDYFVALAGLERVVGIELWHDEHHEENEQ